MFKQKVTRMMISSKDIDFLNSYNDGINCRPLISKYTSDIKDNIYDDSMDVVPKVVFNSKRNKYSIINGKHLMNSKQKIEWLCDVIEGDIGKNDIEFNEYCFDLSTKDGNSSHELAYVHKVDIVRKYYERYIRINGELGYGDKNKSLSFICEKTHYGHASIRKSLNIYVKLKELDLFEIAVKEAWGWIKCSEEIERNKSMIIKNDDLINIRVERKNAEKLYEILRKEGIQIK